MTQTNPKRTGKRAPEPKAKVFLITRSDEIAGAFSRVVGEDNLRVGPELKTLRVAESRAVYVFDTKQADMSGATLPWRDRPSAKWILLASEVSDLEHLAPLPAVSAVVRRSASGIKRAVDLLRSWDVDAPGKQILNVRYDGASRGFSVHFATGKTYTLPVDHIPESDKSAVVRWRVARNRSHFLISQESGNKVHVPWDLVLHLCEPSYKHHYSRAEDSGVDSARRIGARVKALRLARDLTAVELANRSGLQRPNLTRLESGRHVPSLETLERVARALDVPVAELVAV
jgi:DNA-binding XRE family transcriptional regulator